MDALSFSDFETSGRAVLAFLHRRLGFDLWMVTRTEGDDWIVLQSEDHGYGVAPGTIFRWADSFCSEMVKGNGPRIAPRSDAVPAYAAAPIGRQVQIKAYVGLPLTRADGSLFGTLCAIHPSSQPESIVGEQELVEMLGAMLSTILQVELRATEEARRSERLQSEALIDALTGVYNRRGWDRLLVSEEDRCRRYGHPAAILMIDLDELKLVNDTQGHAAGDALIARAGSALRQTARSLDIVARLGGDEFGVLSVECDRAGGEALLKRVRTALADANVKASIGFAMRAPSTGLKGAWEIADQLMYEEKRSR
ncbi:MAG TPA: sensor domain-containing diguanylate cyclase [Gammaproteobacteria bacterium]|nr:sensor domain-containing diguanylate cyclase [Gammaproteobacteria bacterium]